MSIYPNLKAEMTRYGVGVDDIASSISKSSKTVYNWLSGAHEIKHENCVAIRDAYFSGMTTDYLFSAAPIAPYEYAESNMATN